MPRRSGVLLYALTAALTVATAQAENPPHTSPACWDAPRLYHAGPPPGELAERVHLIETPRTPPSVQMPSDETVSPNGAYRFWVRNPDTSKPGPWGGGVIVDIERDHRLTLLVNDIAQPLAPRWINEKLIALRVAWGRVTYSDVILDVERAAVVFHELVRDGTIAFQQFQESCGDACPCDVTGTPAAPAAEPTAEAADPSPQSGIVPAATPGDDALIGLVMLPTVFDPPEQGGVVPAENPVPVPVYDAPEGGARKLAELGAIDDFEHREYTYEGAAAVVYERRPGWYRIGIRAPLDGRGTVWLSEKSAGGFLGLEDLLVGSLAHLDRHWDGYVWTDPVDGMRTGLSQLKRNRDPDDREEYAARVLEVRTVGDGVWLNIETLSDNCAGGPEKVVDRGWVPAYAESGDLVAWFHARGC